MWHKSKSANNKSNGSIRTRYMRFDINVILTARAIVGVKFAAKSGSPLHRPVGRFSTTTHLRRADRVAQKFLFPTFPLPLRAPFLHRYRYEIRVDGQPRAAFRKQRTTTSPRWVSSLPFRKSACSPASGAGRREPPSSLPVPLLPLGHKFHGKWARSFPYDGVHVGVSKTNVGCDFAIFMPPWHIRYRIDMYKNQ